MKTFVSVPISIFAFISLLFACGFLSADGPAARTVKYAQSDIVEIHAKLRFSTLIVLPSDEDILDFTTGDKDYWIINGSHNLCYLHPAAANIQSDLNLITTRGHIYSFLLTEISKRPSEQPDLKVFIEPKEGSSFGLVTEPAAGTGDPPQFVRASEVQAYRDEISALRTEMQQQIQDATAKADQAIGQYRESYPEKLQFDYVYKPLAAKEPFRIGAIYHDDKFTYIQSSAQEKPTVYELKDGKPDMVNFTLQNGVYVIPKIVNHGYIVVGKKKVDFHRQEKHA
jgi:type IV secretory pathway VirB9-like protein